MVSKTLLKEILIQNEQHLLQEDRTILPRLRVPLPPPAKKVAIIYGVRRSGKSYLLYETFRKNREKALYIDFEDDRLADFKMEDFESLYDAFLELKPHLVQEEIVLLFDEIQNVAGWERFCRRLTERTRASVYVTGSSSRIMPQEIHTALRGRSWAIELLPFTFVEFLQARSVDLQDKNRLLYGPLKPQVKKEFLDYLQWGGFPEVASLKTEWERRKILKEYLQAMFFKDLVERYRITNIPLLERLMDMLFSQASRKVSLTAFYKKEKTLIPFSKDSLYEYYRYFLQSLLVYETRVYSSSHYKRSRNPAKCYLVDPGLARRVSSEDQGHLLENLVYLEYRRQGHEIYHFSGEQECDFVFKDDRGGRGCSQVTFELTDDNRSREVGGLLEACKALGSKRGTILTFDDEGQHRQEGVTIDIIPAWKWMLATALE